MTNDPSWDEIFSSQPAAAAPTNPTTAEGTAAQPAAPLTRRQLREAEGRERPVVPERPVDDRQTPPQSPPRPPRRGRGGSGGGYDGLPKRKRRLGWLWALITLLVLALIAGGVALFAWTNYETQVREVMGWQLPIDYEGDGNGEAVNIVINDGDIGQDIADTLYDAGVTMTSQAFYDLLVEEEPTFMPGTYALEKEMSARAALTALEDPANSVVASALIIEGSSAADAFESLAAGTGIPIAEFETAAADYASFGLPAEAPSIEGYLFPATYNFEPSQTAHDILQRLVDETFARLDAAGVPAADRHRVLTLASVVQRESGANLDDMYKISRVFQNRLANSPYLMESDATVAYASGNLHTVWTTDAEREDENGYNTYVRPGLPIGPISLPGDAAIDAALHPVDGSWMYFVPINLATGETVFSNTLPEHEAATAQLRAWCNESEENKKYCA